MSIAKSANHLLYEHEYLLLLYDRPFLLHIFIFTTTSIFLPDYPFYYTFYILATRLHIFTTRFFFYLHDYSSLPNTLHLECMLHFLTTHRKQQWFVVMWLCGHVSMYRLMSVDTDTYTFVIIFCLVCIHVFMYVRMYVRVCVCVCVCVRACVRV